MTSRLRAAEVADRFGYTGAHRGNSARLAMRRYQDETGRGVPTQVVENGRVHLEWDKADVDNAVKLRRRVGHPGGPRRAVDREPSASTHTRDEA